MKKIGYSDQFARKLSYLVKTGTVVAVSFFAVESAAAANWRVEPIFRLGYEIDDNATLNSVATPTEIEGYIVDASAIFGYATERTTFDITPTLRTRNYDDETFDSNDGFLTIDFNHKGIKSNLRIRGN